MSSSPNKLKIDWSKFDTILLDLDGTLLDRHFDDYFWAKYVPKCYAAKQKIPLQEAEKFLGAMYKSKEQTLDWTDLDYWSDTLGLDIPALKGKIQHLIQVHPFVLSFLSFCQSRKKKVYLVTNAHSKTLQIKMAKTSIGKYFDRVICSQEIGCPKEDPIFWRYLQKVIHYDSKTTLLADDTESVLFSAQQAKIRWLIYVARPSSSIPPYFSKAFPSILYFRELLP